MKSPHTSSSMLGIRLGGARSGKIMSSNATSSSYKSARQKSLSGGGSESPFMFDRNVFSHKVESFHSVVSASDGRGRLAATKAQKALRRGGLKISALSLAGAL